MNTKIFLIIGLLFLSLQGIGQVNPTAAIKPANGENYILISRDTFGAARFIYDSVRFDISGDTLYFTDSVRVDLSSVVDTVLEIATKYDITQITGNSTTVTDYSALRLYADSANVVFIPDFTYTFNSISYTTTGGIFRKTSGLTENGSTEIVGVFDWERIHDDIYFPEWFEVGGYDSQGVIFTDKNTSQQGIYNEADRIRNITQIAGLGGTIKFEGGKTYEGIDIRAEVKANQTWNGNGATLKRADCPQVLLTASASIGANSITVDNVDSLRVGQFIGISDLSATNGGIAFDENSKNGGHVIQSIVGNVVTFSNTLCCAFDIGDRVFVHSSFLSNISGDDYQNLNIYNLKIDGNKSKNQYTVDWRLNPSFNLGTGKNLVINNVTFSNTPSENVFANQCNCLNLKGNNLNGSLFHISASSVDSTNVSRFINCDLDSVNMGTNLLMDHSEAAITWSQNVGKVIIDNCIFRNGQEGVTGGGGSSSIGGLQVTNSVFEKFNNAGGTLFIFSTSTVDIKKENFLFANNRFENCGDIQFLGKDVKKGFSISKINILNNYFINTRFYFNNVSEVRFENNDVIEKRGFGGFNGFTSALTSQDAFIQFSRFDRLNFVNNRIIGDTLYSSFTARGLLLYAFDTGKRKDSLGVDTEVYYAQNVKVIGNTISNFIKGISVDISHVRAYDAVVVGWHFDNNTINMYKDDTYTSVSYGMQVLPNCIATNNTINMFVDGNSSQYAAFIYGIDEGAATGRKNRLQGGIFRYNRVNGLVTRSIAVGNSSGSSNKYNCIVEYNILPKALVNFAGVESHVQNNIVLPTLLPNLTAPTLLINSELEQYKNKY